MLKRLSLLLGIEVLFPFTEYITNTKIFLVLASNAHSIVLINFKQSVCHSYLLHFSWIKYRKILDKYINLFTIKYFFNEVQLRYITRLNKNYIESSNYKNTMTKPIEKAVESSTNVDIASRDDVFDMFLDEDFVPQAYVDILLSNIDYSNLNQVQALSSGLLTRLDFYTRSLTNELEANIWNLERLSETLPGTWSASQSTDDVSNDNSENNGNELTTSTVSNSSFSLSPRVIGGVSKLEYYLDTLGSSVKSLESDLSKVELELTQSYKKNGGEQDRSKQVVDKLKALKLIKTRLYEVLNIFTKLRDIMVISDADITHEKDAEAIRTFSFDDFKLSLSTLQETIEQTLDQSLKAEDSTTINKEFLVKIEQFVKLTPVFKSLDRFYEEYEKFAEAVSQSSNKYLEGKEIID